MFCARWAIAALSLLASRSSDFAGGGLGFVVAPLKVPLSTSSARPDASRLLPVTVSSNLRKRSLAGFAQLPRSLLPLGKLPAHRAARSSRRRSWRLSAQSCRRQSGTTKPSSKPDEGQTGQNRCHHGDLHPQNPHNGAIAPAAIRIGNDTSDCPPWERGATFGVLRLSQLQEIGIYGWGYPKVLKAGTSRLHVAQASSLVQDDFVHEQARTLALRLRRKNCRISSPSGMSKIEHALSFANRL